MDIKFGVEAKDKVTGFTGIVTGKCQYMYGCTQYCLVPSVDKDGKIVDGSWFDEGRIEVLGHGIKPEDVKGEKNGGPNRDTPKRVI